MNVVVDVAITNVQMIVIAMIAMTTRSSIRVKLCFTRLQAVIFGKNIFNTLHAPYVK